MSEDITESLARIGEQTARLNQLCDEGAATIRDLEHRLEKMSVGVPASVVLHAWGNDEYPEYTEFELLTYDRIGARFRIGVRSGSADEQTVSEAKPWSDCPRDVKIECLEHLPELVTKIAEEVELRVKAAENAIASVKKLTPSAKKEG